MDIGLRQKIKLITREKLLGLPNAIKVTLRDYKVVTSSLKDSIKSARPAIIENWEFSEQSLPNLKELIANYLGVKQVDEIGYQDLTEQEFKERSEVFQMDSDYPEELFSLIYPPICLYWRGNLDLLKTNTISIVGTREPTQVGVGEARRLVEFAKRNMLTTISGLANGIDTVVHQESIDNNLPTISVFPFNLDYVYPTTNIGLAKQIVENGGLLLSEHRVKIPFNNSVFPLRNRIIGALGKATVIIEAGEGSGALYTAEYAYQVGREVFAALGFPYNEKLAGNMSLFDSDIARPLTKEYKILRDVYKIQSSGKPTRLTIKNLIRRSDVTDFEKQILILIVQGQREVSDIKANLERTKYKIYLKDINVILAQMQLRGILKRDAFGNLEISL